MGQPFGKFPLLPLIFTVIDINQLHVRIRVSGRDLGGKDVHNVDGPLFADAADQTDHMVIRQVYPDRYVIEGFIFFFDQCRFFLQVVVRHGKLFFGHVNLNLERLVPYPKTVGKEVLMPPVPAP